MVAFGRDDASRFFGREKEVAEIRDRLASQGVLCLVGPSGCGKSSLIEAGVLADLDSAEAGHWDVRTFRPGGSPMFALGGALGADPDDTTTPESAIRAVRESLAAGPEAGRLLLVIDQLEELFAQASTDDQAQFITALTGIHELGVSIVLAIRADFYGELMESALWPLVGDGTVDVPPLAGHALAEAIEKPATSCHVIIEPDLLEQLVSDAGSEPGALPLLQEALVRLWGTMRLHRVSLAAYESIGGEGRDGLTAAVADTADAALAALSPDQVPIAKRVLLRLVQFGQGRPDTRRQLRVGELRSEGDDDRALEVVLEVLANARLVTLTGAASPAATTASRDDDRVDLAHEALIAAWPTMREWLSERRDAELARRRLEGHVATWEEHDRRAAFLDDVQLREAQRWLAGPDARELGIPRGLSELVAVSAARLRRRRRLSRGAIAGLVVLTLAAIALAGVFLRARNDAIHRANVALSRERAASALSELSVDPQRSLRLALQAVDALGKDDATTQADRREAVAALRDAVGASRLRAVLKGHKAEVVSAHFDPTGRRVVTAGWDGTARVWDARTGASEVILRAGRGHLETAAFSGDGKRVVTAGPDNSARLWNATTGALLLVLRHASKSHVLDAEFGPGDRLVVTAGSDGTARIWKADTGMPVARLGHARGKPIGEATFSPDGSRVATAGENGLAVVWSTSTGKRLAQLRHGEPVTTVRFGPNGQLVTASFDGTARVWHPFSPRLKPVVLSGHKGAVVDAAFDPDGTRIVTASFDGTARLWNPRTGKELTIPLSHGDAVTSGSFSSDGARVVTASADHTARIWDARTGTELAVLRGHDNYVGGAEFSPDGKRVVTSSSDHTARVWDATASEPVVTIGGPGFRVASAAVSPTRAQLAAASPDGAPRVSNPETGAAIASLATGGDSVVHAVFSANGRDIVTWDATGVRVWDPATGMLRSTKLPRGRPVGAVPSPDAARIVSLSVGSDDPYTTVDLWDRTRKEPVAAWRLDGRGEGAGFDASGSRVVAWSDEGVVTVWDVASRRRLVTLSVPGVRRVAALSPDGLRVATGAGDGTVQIWNVADGREVKRFHHALPVVAVSFDANGGRLLAASADGTAKIWDARTDRDPIALRGHQTEITDASFDSTGRWVVTASLDRTARVWDGLTGQEIERFHHPAQVTAARFGRDARHVVTVAGDFRARVFGCETCVPLEALVRLARGRLVPGPG